jgi:outer membrane protein OmpA-like peptidoglycan-associated protein
MRHLFFLVAMPLLFDACVAAGLGATGPASLSPPQITTNRGYVVFFDWDGVELSANGRRVVAEAARDATRRGFTRIAVLGEIDPASGPDYAAALALERARRVRAELLRDGLAATDIGTTGEGNARGTRHRIELVLQGTI